MDLLIEHYLPEFLAVLAITIVTVISPGPDFFVVAKNSLSHSKRSGVFTALGVASAVWVHVFYTLAGVGLILSKSIILFAIVKYLGAAYLIYLGWSCLKNSSSNPLKQYQETSSISDLKSFKMGFINNMLNPKAPLFFLALFTQVVSHDTPLEIQIVYGLVVSLACAIWLTLVALFLNQKSVRKAFERAQTYIEKAMGAVLIGLGVKVSLSSQ